MQHLSLVTLVVPDYDDAVAFYVDRVGFELIDDTPVGPAKRWVVISPPGAYEARILLAKAADDDQLSVIGRQTGGRVGFFLSTDDFDRDHTAMAARGVRFLEDPRTEPYGKVAVFQDPYGNKWDLIQPVA